LSEPPLVDIHLHSVVNFCSGPDIRWLPPIPAAVAGRDELSCATAFASRWRRPANAACSRPCGTATALTAIQDLSARLNRMQDIEGIGEAIVSEADRLIAHDTIRVYRVDHVAQTCEPVAFQGQFMGIGRPSTEMLRVRIGEGLTGWVALHNCSIRLGDAASDPRGMQVGQSRGADPCSSSRCRTSPACWA
jgi:hypothetical protein